MNTRAKKERFYSLFHGIKSRCSDPKRPYFSIYWGKWIECEWKNFEEFMRDMLPSYEEHVKEFWERNTQIDRIDSNKNYSKSNCRWVTTFEQARNKKTNILIEFNWERKVLKDWCTLLKLRYNTINCRISKYWWDHIRALTTPIDEVRAHQRKYELI